MELMISIIWAVLPVAAYLLGSIPFGVVLARKMAGVDIRTEGSGNIGATNVRRVAGSKLAALTLLGDILKGAVPVFMALAFEGAGWISRDVYVAVVALSAFSGHLYPVYMRFRNGGKGVATAAGCFLVISPQSVLASVFVFAIMLGWTKRVSVGSICAAVVLPPAVWMMTGSVIFAGCAGITAIGIVCRHRDNIRRLINGTEPSLSDRQNRR